MCPWNVRFSRELPNDSPYAAREALGGKDARTLARELLGMSQTEFSAAFEGSPTKRVLRFARGQGPLRRLKRNARWRDVLTHALDDDEPPSEFGPGQPCASAQRA